MKNALLPLSIIQGSTSVLETVFEMADRENDRSAKQKLAETSIEFAKIQQAGEYQHCQFELQRQAGEIKRQMLENERRRDELHHEIAMEQNRLEKAKLKVEVKKIEHQAAILKEWLNHLPEMIEYKKHKFNISMEFLNKQLDYCYSYCCAERAAFLEHKKLCVEEQTKARIALDTTLYAQITKTIKNLDKNIKRIDNEFHKLNNIIATEFESLQKDTNENLCNVKMITDFSAHSKYLK